MGKVGVGGSCGGATAALLGGVGAVAFGPQLAKYASNKLSGVGNDSNDSKDSKNEKGGNK